MKKCNARSIRRGYNPRHKHVTVYKNYCVRIKAHD